MAITRVADHLLMISRKFVHCYIIEAGDGLTLIDSGWEGTEDLILKGVAQLGRPASDLRHIILTHAHPDHIGSAATVKRATGATVLIHATDRAIAERGSGIRPLTASPEFKMGLLFRVFGKLNQSVPPIPVDGTIADGEVLPIAGGLEIIATPGHCAGQVAVRWQPRRILFTADTCTNLFGLGDPVGFEDFAEGKRSQARLARLDFDTACFGHGPPIGDGADRFRRKWGRLEVALDDRS